jgi:hypothetical protein
MLRRLAADIAPGAAGGQLWVDSIVCIAWVRVELLFGPMIVKPARSIVTSSVVIVKHTVAALGKVMLLTSLYDPGLLIVWHFSISIGPSCRASCACALARGASITAPRASAIAKHDAGVFILSSLSERH